LVRAHHRLTPDGRAAAAAFPSPTGGPHEAFRFPEGRARRPGCRRIGATYVARAPADGYTLLLMPNSQTITRHVQQNSGFVGAVIAADLARWKSVTDRVSIRLS
jgi:hypothetical protein